MACFDHQITFCSVKITVILSSWMLCLHQGHWHQTGKWFGAIHMTFYFDMKAARSDVNLLDSFLKKASKTWTLLRLVQSPSTILQNFLELYIQNYQNIFFYPPPKKTPFYGFLKQNYFFWNRYCWRWRPSMKSNYLL